MVSASSLTRVPAPSRVLGALLVLERATAWDAGLMAAGGAAHVISLLPLTQGRQRAVALELLRRMPRRAAGRGHAATRAPGKKSRWAPPPSLQP